MPIYLLLVPLFWRSNNRGSDNRGSDNRGCNVISKEAKDLLCNFRKNCYLWKFFRCDSVKGGGNDDFAPPGTTWGASLFSYT